MLLLLLLLPFPLRFLRRCRRCPPPPPPPSPPPPSLVVIAVASHCERTYFSLEAIRLYLFNCSRETVRCEIAGKPSLGRKRTWRNWIQSCCHDLDTYDLFHIYVNEYCSYVDRSSSTRMYESPILRSQAIVRGIFFPKKSVSETRTTHGQVQRNQMGWPARTYWFSIISNVVRKHTSSLRVFETMHGFRSFIVCYISTSVALTQAKRIPAWTWHKQMWFGLNECLQLIFNSFLQSSDWPQSLRLNDLRGVFLCHFSLRGKKNIARKRTDLIARRNGEEKLTVQEMEQNFSSSIENSGEHCQLIELIYLYWNNHWAHRINSLY